MYLHTVTAIADDIVDGIDEPSQALLKELTESELPSLHHTWGMAIRNHYGLWKADHPLTTHWHNSPDERNIIGGVDHSEDHPDQVSMKIMTRVHQKINA